MGKNNGIPDLVCEKRMHNYVPFEGVGGHIVFGMNPVSVSVGVSVSIAFCLCSNL